MNLSDTVTANATPRPVYRMLTWTLVVSIAVLFMVGITLIFTYSGRATTSDVVSQGKHRDCVTTVATARNAVFQNVDIYKAIEIQLLSSALLDSSNGVVHTQAEKDALKATYQANDDKLKMSLVEARRLQPANFLDRVIDHGGVIDGVRYPACPG